MRSKGSGRWRAGSAMALVAVLTACGGGGSSGSRDIDVPNGIRSEFASSNSNVSSANFDQFAEPMVHLVASAGGSPAEGTLAYQKAGRDATALDAAALSSAQHALGAPAVARLLKIATQESFDPQAKAAQPRAQAQAAESVRRTCANGGTWRTTTDDDDNDGLPSPGDSIVVSFDDCRVDSLALPADGGFSFVIDDVDLDRDFNVVGLVVDGYYEDLTIGSAASLDGAFTAWQTVNSKGVERYRFSYSNVRATTLGGTMIYDVDIDGVFDGPTNTYALDGAIGLGNQRYKIMQADQGEFFANRSPIPSRGVLYLQDARGDTVSLQAGANERLDFYFFPAGASLPTFEWVGQSWSAFGV